MKRLKKTIAYIHTQSPGRVGHHVHCVKRSMIDSLISLDDMTQAQLRAFDDKQAKYLYSLDAPYCTECEHQTTTTNPISIDISLCCDCYTMLINERLAPKELNK